MKSNTRFAGLIFFSWGLTACSTITQDGGATVPPTPPPQERTPEVKKVAPSKSHPPKVIKVPEQVVPEGRDEPDVDELQVSSQPASGPTAGSAVIALLAEATEQGRLGDGEQAAAILERALRIEPGNAWLWHRLAVLRMQQSDWGAALELAAKSNSLASGDSRLMGGNWKVIALSLAGKGDIAGAGKAQARSDRLFQLAP